MAEESIIGKYIRYSNLDKHSSKAWYKVMDKVIIGLHMGISFNVIVPVTRYIARNVTTDEIDAIDPLKVIEIIDGLPS